MGGGGLSVGAVGGSFDRTEDFRLRDSSLTDSWSNRNALHVDTTGEISKAKGLFKRAIDSVLGRRDESIAGEEAIDRKETKNVAKLLNGNESQEEIIGMFFNSYSKGKKFLREIPVNRLYNGNLEDLIQTFNYVYGEESFVLIEDKESYLKNKKEEILEEINIKGYRISKVNKHILILLLENKLIDINEIKLHITSFIDFKTIEIPIKYSLVLSKDLVILKYRPNLNTIPEEDRIIYLLILRDALRDNIITNSDLSEEENLAICEININNKSDLINYYLNELLKEEQA